MTLEEAAERLRINQKVIIASHDGPDADGLGASYALAIGLRSIGKQALAVLNGPMPAKFRFIDRNGLFISLAAGSDLPLEPAEACFVLLDTQDFGYLGNRVDELRVLCRETIVIDHHEVAKTARPECFVDSNASSTCELAYTIMERLGIQLPEDAAEALFAGIVYDTGSFAYRKTTASTFACAHSLVLRGVQPAVVHNRMYESSSIGVLLLQKMVFSSLELLAENRIAVQTLKRNDLASSGAAYEDAEDLVNIPLQGRTIEVSILFKENLEGKLRCSLRSKGRVNVAHLAQQFGGGGHKTAAGFTCDRPLERIKADVLKNIVDSLEA